MGLWPAIITDPDALWPTEDYPEPVRDDQQQVVPADLARELYEAMCSVYIGRWHVSKQERWNAVLERYEREVGF